MRELKPGDLVLLKSGGLPMTVSRFEEGSFAEPAQVCCSWHSSQGEPFEGFYPVSCLELVSDNEAYQKTKELRALELDLRLADLKAAESRIKQAAAGIVKTSILPK